MPELRILEGLIAFLLILPLLKPFFTKLDLNGLVLLPPLGLGITIAMFPVYGFRMECVPLLIFAFFENFLFAPSITMLLKDPRYDTSMNERPLLFGISVIFLAAVTAMALFFAPAAEAGLSAPEFITRQVQAPGGIYTLRIYGPGEVGEEPPEGKNPPEAPGGPRPLMVLIPPKGASFMPVDRVCHELRNRGFTVISYSRAGLDAGKAREDRLPAAVYGLWDLHRRGHRFAAANARGRALEAERLEDAGFLLSQLRGNLGRDPALAGVDLRNIFLAGYGAGGGALTALAGSRGFTAENPGVRGIISVEGPLFSAFREEAPPPTLLPEKPWYRRVLARIAGRLSRLRPPPIVLGPVPVSGLPLLCIVSDRAIETRYRNGRYAALFAALRAAREPAVLAAVPGAGLLDYSDLPGKYPLYRLLFPGRSGDRWKKRDFPGETASLMANFAALFLEGPRDEAPAAGVSPAASPDFPVEPPPESGLPPPRGVLLRRTPLGESLYLERGGVWNFHKPEDILGL